METSQYILELSSRFTWLDGRIFGEDTYMAVGPKRKKWRRPTRNTTTTKGLIIVVHVAFKPDKHCGWVVAT